MDDQPSSVLVELLDDESRFSYLNHYYQTMLIETDDEVYTLKLDTMVVANIMLFLLLPQIQMIMMVMNEVLKQTNLSKLV